MFGLVVALTMAQRQPASDNGKYVCVSIVVATKKIQNKIDANGVYLHFACPRENSSVFDPVIARVLSNSIAAFCISSSACVHNRLTNHFIAIATAKNFILLSLIFSVVRAATRFIAFGIFFFYQYRMCTQSRKTRAQRMNGKSYETFFFFFFKYDMCVEKLISSFC